MRGMYPLNRAEQWPRPISYRLPAARSGVLLAILFAVGLGLGLVASRSLAGPTVQTVTEADYASIVAQLFARDHNVGIARDRLALYGSPAAMVDQAVRAAENGDLKTPSDGVALQALAQALGTASSAPSTTSATSPTGAPDEHVSWVGPLAAFLLALALGAVVLLRTAGLSLPRPALPSVRADRPGSADVLEDRPSASLHAYRPATGRRGPVAEPIGRHPDEEHDLVLASGATRPAERPREASRGRAAIRPARLLTFQSCYGDGDEQFDEIYPITDPTTGTLVAACGLNAALKCDPTGRGHYYAFTAWMQDYANGDELNAVGLVAPGAADVESREIDEWVRSGQIDGVLSVQSGTTTEIQTSEHRATVTIVDVAFGDEQGAPNRIFDQLTVRFEIVPKVHLEEA